jgi:hypothetical protein
MQFGLNLRNRTAEAALAQTAIAEKRLGLERTRLEQAIDAQVRNALQGLVASRERIAAAEASAKAAEEKLNSEVPAFSDGRIDQLFVLQRQNELLEVAPPGRGGAFGVQQVRRAPRTGAGGGRLKPRRSGCGRRPVENLRTAGFCAARRSRLLSFYGCQ